MPNTATALTQTELALMLADIVCPSDTPPMWHKGTAYITNGHVGFLIEGVDQPVDWALWEGDRWANVQKESNLKTNPDDLRRALADDWYGKATYLDFELPAIEPRESWLNPNKVVSITCDECDGTGEVKGSRLSAEAREIIETKVGGIDSRYLWIVSRLAEFRSLNYRQMSAPHLGLCFSFQSGYGIAMAVRTH